MALSGLNIYNFLAFLFLIWMLQVAEQVIYLCFASAGIQGAVIFCFEIKKIVIVAGNMCKNRNPNNMLFP